MNTSWNGGPSIPYRTNPQPAYYPQQPWASPSPAPPVISQKDNSAALRALVFGLFIVILSIALVFDFLASIPASLYIYYAIVKGAFSRYVVFILFPLLLPTSSGWHVYIIIPLFFITGISLAVFYTLIFGITTWASIKSAYVGLKEASINILPSGEFKEYSMLFYADVSFSIAFAVYLSIFSVHTNIPNFGADPLWYRLFEFQNAGAWEEIISRSFLIGLPVGLYTKLVYRKNKLFRYMLGGNIPVTPKTGILLVFSSFLFAMAHVSGWDAYKAIPTFVGGLFLGYAFMRYGLHVSVLMHFLLDYTNVAAEAVDKYTGTYSMEFLAAMFIVVSGVLGVVTFGKYMKVALESMGLWKSHIPEALAVGVILLGFGLNYYLYMNLSGQSGFSEVAAIFYLVFYTLGVSLITVGIYLYQLEKESDRVSLTTVVVLGLSVFLTLPFGYAASPLVWHLAQRLFNKQDISTIRARNQPPGLSPTAWTRVYM